mmetsp:Transcript_12666/g.23506  ORF Transcript_12666/g.23506 Transcript_12666/m.23506 type:complete len:204 (-) Transcript_12666:109-720(-)
MLVGNFVAKPIGHFLGYLYPAYESYKAVKRNDPNLHTQWLTFWIVSTYMSIVETFGDTLLSWLPFYYELKVALLVWLVAPNFRGATKVYHSILDPYLIHYEKDIDQGVNEVKRRSAEQLGALGQLGIKQIRSQSAELIRLGSQVLGPLSPSEDVSPRPGDLSREAKLEREYGFVNGNNSSEGEVGSASRSSSDDDDENYDDEN